MSLKPNQIAHLQKLIDEQEAQAKKAGDTTAISVSICMFTFKFKCRKPKK